MSNIIQSIKQFAGLSTDRLINQQSAYIPRIDNNFIEYIGYRYILNGVEYKSSTTGDILFKVRYDFVRSINKPIIIGEYDMESALETKNIPLFLLFIDGKLYNNAIERGNFHRILTGKINAFNDSETYTEKFKKTAANRKSKTEERCFNMIKENVDSSINNEPYIVIFPPSFISSCDNVRSNEDVDNAKYYACDGYIEYNGKIIIVEYDSGLFHDKENDEKRDNDIFYLDDNVLGILRITENFFLSIKSINKDKKYEEIKNAIEDIKSVRRDRIIL